MAPCASMQTCPMPWFVVPSKTPALTWGRAVTRERPRGLSRRQVFREGAALATGAVAVGSLRENTAMAAVPVGNAQKGWSQSYSGRKSMGETRAWPPGEPGKDYNPVSLAGGAVLPFKVV